MKKMRKGDDQDSRKGNAKEKSIMCTFINYLNTLVMRNYKFVNSVVMRNYKFVKYSCDQEKHI